MLYCCRLVLFFFVFFPFIFFFFRNYSKQFNDLRMTLAENKFTNVTLHNGIDGVQGLLIQDL